MTLRGGFSGIASSLAIISKLKNPEELVGRSYVHFLAINLRGYILWTCAKTVHWVLLIFSHPLLLSVKLLHLAAFYSSLSCQKQSLILKPKMKAACAFQKDSMACEFDYRSPIFCCDKHMALTTILC